ncbi:mechanosensitive ion channel protein MscS [Afifella sp. IM 167]|nr:mechanosensitive ion channel protein MscS [Afifella sp. IM 167]
MPLCIRRAAGPLTLILAAFLVLAPFAGQSAAQSLPLSGLSGGSGGSSGSESGSSSDSSQASDGAFDTELKARLLADILKDDKARQALIEQLQRIAEPQTEAAAAGRDEEAATTAPADDSLARQLADATKGAAEATYGVVDKLFRDLKGLGAFAQQAVALDWNEAGAVLARLLGTILVTTGALFVLSWGLQRLSQSITRRLNGSKALTASISFVAETVADLIALGIAYALGTGLAVGVFGTGGEMRIEQSLYLNAFVIVGTVRVLLRAIIAFEPSATSLIQYREGITDYAYKRLMLVVSLLVYGIAFLVPITNVNFSFLAGRGLRVALVLLASIIALVAIRKLAHRIQEARTDKPEDLSGQALAILSHVWPWIAALYVLVVLVISITRPYVLVSFVVGASVRTALAIGIGIALTALLRFMLRRGVKLPAWFGRDLPVLERRLNTLIPMMLQIVRTLVAIIVVLAIIDAWNVLNVSGWLATDAGANAVARIVSALIIIGMAYLLWLGVSSWIEHRLSYGKQGSLPSARARTILSLARNGLSITIFVIAGMLALSQLGVNIGPLLAGAGVLGLAVGFGSQKLVQDVITGAFIQFENAINEGDVVTVAGISGVVEKLTVRSVGLRDLSGVYHIVPFSSVDAVSNFMRKFAYHLAEIGIAYRENVSDAKEAMRAAFDRLKESEYGTDIIDDFEMHGVTELGDSAVVVRARIKTLPGSQWAVGRAYTEFVKEVFDERGIEIPFPHRTLYLGTYKDGSHDTLPISLKELGEGGAALRKAAGAEDGEAAQEPDEAPKNEGETAGAETAKAPAGSPKRRRPRRKRSDEPRLPDPKRDHDDSEDDGD